ncbi:ABC transporter ATP-binding protein [Thermococcus thioreducens]|uniref:ABC-2 type transport system ATP-binding protein n=1 Tax=Thermococcus thioreducens TaxID=277988 RepID=A0A0Q2M3W8_9EURY|nr:ABC transporter ATP-binding protein [Thermococcus thioreducens]ASJ11600.1 daunorubicin ABC transporter ATP-binding protein [Thermococcus thioreducens]KQH82658.1 daunorubicin ABC transporter ATP-binding protein [Thermococcus thioreducens]SEW17143.1 ABC-2 type transport system ATP-binding protein [Thermococcus thioreducens]
MPSVEVRGLSKWYSSKKALSDVSFTVEDGEIVGVIGPNAAGKTTLIRILSCLLKPDSGEVRIFGKKPCQVKGLFALLPQDVKAHFYTLTPRDYAYHYLRMRGLGREEARRTADDAMKLFGIDYADEPMSTLSGGMVRRALLAMVLSADAGLYFLDEPTVGLDVENRLKLWDVIRKKAEESTIVLTSHYLNEISSVCDRVLLLKGGRVRAFGRPEEIAREYLSGLHSKVVAFGDVTLEGFLLKKAGRNTYIYARSGHEEKEIMEALESAGIPFRRESLTIEDVFIAGGLGDGDR